MATTITIDYDDRFVTVHVTDDTGRDQTATTRRYPHPESAQYVKFVDALDVLMYQHDDARICGHVSPFCGPGHCKDIDPRWICDRGEEHVMGVPCACTLDD